MARQAGASFSVDDPEEQARQAAQQLAIPTLGFQPGELLRNAHTGDIGCVIRVEQRLYAWVVLRVKGQLHEVTVTEIGEHWFPCRPDGSAR